jgi:hypothetical protein
MGMKKVAIVAGIISMTLIMGATRLNAQNVIAVEFIDQMGLGWGYGFIKDKDYAGSNFNIDYLLGAHIHNWNTAILAGIRFNLKNLSLSNINMDVGGQVEHFFGFFDSRRLTGFGASLGGGVQLLNDFNVVTVLYIRAGGIWHFGTMVKFALEFDYRFNGQMSAGIMVSMPWGTIPFRLNAYKRLYVERNTAANKPKQEEEEPFTLTIVNMLDIPISHIYISPVGINEWEDILELIADKPVLPRKGVFFQNLSPARYDIRVEDADGYTYTFLDINLARDGLAVGRLFDIDKTKRDQ